MKRIMSKFNGILNKTISEKKHIKEAVIKKRINKSYIHYSEDDGEVVIDTLFVHPTERGNKVGHKLLDVALKYARKRGMNMALYAEPQNDGALDSDDLVEYYEDYGFEQDGDAKQLMTYYI